MDPRLAVPAPAVPAADEGRFVLCLTGTDAEVPEQLADTFRSRGVGALFLAPRDAWWLPRPVRFFHPEVSPEAYLIDHVVPELKAKHGAKSFALFGWGMGGQGALRIAFKYPRLFPSVAVVNPWIDFHERYWEDDALQEAFPDVETARQYTATLWINPLDRPLHILLVADPEDGRWYRGIERLHDKLLAIGVPHEWWVRPRAGTADVVDAAQWLVERVF